MIPAPHWTGFKLPQNSTTKTGSLLWAIVVEYKTGKTKIMLWIEYVKLTTMELRTNTTREALGNLVRSKLARAKAHAETVYGYNNDLGWLPTVEYKGRRLQFTNRRMRTVKAVRWYHYDTEVEDLI